MNKLVKECKKEDLYAEFLKSLNGIIRLPKRELQLLTELVNLQLNKQLLPGTSESVISTENRKYLSHTLGITPDNLSRYICKFKDLGLLVRGKIDNEWLVSKILIPEIIKDRVQITIILKIKDDVKEETQLHST